MSVPRTPGIYIGMMSLIMTALLAWSSIVAPCMEIGFFWSAAATAFGVAWYAHRTAEKIGQGGMLIVYSLLGGAVMLMVASLVDLANFSFMGRAYDGESGIFLGAAVSYIFVTAIAFRLFSRFTAAFFWWSILLISSSLWINWGLIESLPPQFTDLIVAAGFLHVLIVFTPLSRCKQKLSDRQYLVVIGSIILFIFCSLTYVGVDAVLALLGDIALLLLCIHYLHERPDASVASRILTAMPLLIIFDDLANCIVSSGVDTSDISEGIPTALLAVIIILSVRNIGEQIPRGLYWTTLFTFGLLIGVSLLPSGLGDTSGLSLVYTLSFFCAVTLWYLRLDWMTAAPWRAQFRQLAVFTGCSLAVLLTVISVTLALSMMAANIGPARFIAAYVCDTPYWPGNKSFVRLAMNDESLWHDGVLTEGNRNQKLSSYLKKVRPFSDRFSYVSMTSDDKDDDLGVSEGIGVHWESIQDQMTLVRVNRNSPAGRAGLLRGDRLLAIDGIKTAELIDTESIKWERLYSNWKTKDVVSLDLMTCAGVKRKVTLPFGDGTLDSPVSRVINGRKGVRIGYLYLHSFSTSQFERLEEHFGRFKKEGVRDLVIDLRYNGGGSVAHLATLGSLIAGNRLAGKPFVQIEHSQRYEDRDSVYTFKQLQQSLSARQVIVLTTSETCSASEALINGMKPYIQVTTVGSATCGKPFSMKSIEFGSLTLHPVTGRITNSLGNSGYDEGIRPDYPAEDDISHQLGDSREGMLKTALTIINKEI